MIFLQKHILDGANKTFFRSLGSDFCPGDDIYDDERRQRKINYPPNLFCALAWLLIPELSDDSSSST